MKTKFSDVLIIGSGFGGAVPALRFAKAGFQTTILDKGPAIDPYKDFVQTQDPKYIFKYLKIIKSRNLSLNYVEGEGGGSGFYECVTLRSPSITFDQRDCTGRKLWPANLDRKSFDPFYDIGEKMMNVHQIHEKQVPKSGLIFSSLMKNLGYSVDRARYAVKNCMNCGRCITGCIYGAKQSLLVNYLPTAIDAGAKLESNLDAVSIKPLPGYQSFLDKGSNEQKWGFKYQVLCKNSTSGEQITFLTKILFLAGGTIGTPKMLLASRRYLPDLSDEVGNNIAFNGSVKIAGLLPKWSPDADLFTGRSHPGIVSYQFVNTNKVMISTAKPLPLQLFGSARLTLKDEMTKNDYWGAKHVKLMKMLRRRIIFLVAHGMTPPSAKVSLGMDGNLKLHLKMTDNLKTYYDSTKQLLESIITRNGGRLINVDFQKLGGSVINHTHFTSSHQVGSCRMADSKKNGVVDSNGELFDYPGIFITDGSAIPGSTIVNVSLTILANAERITSEAVKRYSKLKSA